MAIIGDNYGNSPGINVLATNSSDHIFAGTEKGMFRSTNNGNSWIAANTNLKDKSGNKLEINALLINSSDHI